MEATTHSWFLVVLILRVLTFVCLLASFIVKTAYSMKYFPDSQLDSVPRAYFPDFDGLRYMGGAEIIGLAYTIMQIVFSTCHLIKGNHILGSCTRLLDFYGDKVISYLLIKEIILEGYPKLFDKLLTSALLLLFAFLCTAILSFMSSHKLKNTAAGA